MMLSKTQQILQESNRDGVPVFFREYILTMLQV